MGSTTHLRCTDGIIAALLAHPNYQSNTELIQEAQKLVVGHRGKWAYAFHLPTEEAKKTLMKCLPDLIKRQQSTGLWKRKYAEVYTYGLLRALKHAKLLEQDKFRYDLYQTFREKTNLISNLVRKNIMNENNVDIENVVAELFSNQLKNGSWFNSLSATCFQLQILKELGIDASHELVSFAIKWLFKQFHEAFAGRAKTWSFDFENIFLTDNYAAEQNGFQQVAPEHSRNPCIGSLVSGIDSYIIQNPAITTAIALYTLTRLGYGNDKRIVDAYESLYNIRGIRVFNGEINDNIGWCTGLYRPKSVHYDLELSGVSFDDYLQVVKKRKSKHQKNKD
ncbi:MAG: hypothetical protein ACW96X_06160 [Promethearchaeota archaeon]|jgi:hypothetical protein